MNRRSFLRLSAAATFASKWVSAQSDSSLDLRNCAIRIPLQLDRGKKMAQVLVEEAEKRSGIRWHGPDQPSGDKARVVIYLGTRDAMGEAAPRVSASMRDLPPEAFLLESGRDAGRSWIAVIGADQRGLLFGIGKLLRLIDFGRQEARLPSTPLYLVSHPEYRLRGHQLGYRPKTNAYDAWSVSMWDQYIRDLALFGTNSIELLPPRTDDLPDSPLFPLPPRQMMTEMSRIADSYGLNVWVWYPAMDGNYADPATVETAVQEWAAIFAALPRIDAVFVPGGDPGHTEPKYLLPLLEKQKASLRRYHPRAQMWVSPQGFNSAWLDEFLQLLDSDSTKSWLDGVVFGPMSRLSIVDLRNFVPRNYSIRCYPDITHSIECQYPVLDWDLAFALTEGREVINPRPQAHSSILREILPSSIGFISYSEGCNDDVNKFLWSSLAWDSRQPVTEVLRDFAHWFIGKELEEGFAQGLCALEANWVGPLMTNAGVEVTLERFADLERSCPPAVTQNWRFQQALYRAYFDALVRRRLIDETAHVVRARDILSRALEIGWAAVPLGVGEPPAPQPPNGLQPDLLLSEAQDVLEEAILSPAGGELRTRIMELGAQLFQSIGMQLAVERYDGEAVERAANLDTLDAPVTDVMWMRREILSIREQSDPMKQIAAIRALLFRTDPGPGGFYDALGDIANRPHLVLSDPKMPDPYFHHHPIVGCQYPDRLQDRAPQAWKHWAGALYEAPLQLHYSNLDKSSGYKVRVVYSGDSPKIKLRLVANDAIEIHPFLLRAWPPAPQEFPIPKQATAGGKLTLTWTREPGLGGNGRGCQIAEVWLIPNFQKEPA